MSKITLATPEKTILAFDDKGKQRPFKVFHRVVETVTEVTRASVEKDIQDIDTAIQDLQARRVVLVQVCEEIRKDADEGIVVDKT